MKFSGKWMELEKKKIILSEVTQTHENKYNTSWLKSGC